MTKQKHIRQILAAIMLFSFAFSIVPQKSLHNWLGCHNKRAVITHDQPGETVSAESFHCSCDQPELQQPFTPALKQTLAGPAPSPTGYYTESLSLLVARTAGVSTLRGPPSFA